MRLNLLLLLAVMASALYLVHTQYESRRLYTELDRSISESRRLESDHQRLQVEKRAQATPLRVEQMARAQLKMVPSTPAITQYVIDPGPSASPQSVVVGQPVAAGKVAP